MGMDEADKYGTKDVIRIKDQAGIDLRNIVPKLLT